MGIHNRQPLDRGSLGEACDHPLDDVRAGAGLAVAEMARG